MTDDRPDALLTSSQRAFLAGDTDTDWNEPAGRTQRTRVRERLRAGLEDFALLADPDGLSERDADQLKDSLAGESLFSALAEMVAFIYRLAPEQFESITEAGTERGVTRFAPENEVREVSIQIEQRGGLLDRARRQMEENNPLTDREVRVLLENGDLPAEEIREHVREHPLPRADNSLYGFR